MSAADLSTESLAALARYRERHSPQAGGPKDASAQIRTAARTGVVRSPSRQRPGTATAAGATPRLASHGDTEQEVRSTIELARALAATRMSTSSLASRAESTNSPAPSRSVDRPDRAADAAADAAATAAPVRSPTPVQRSNSNSVRRAASSAHAPRGSSRPVGNSALVAEIANVRSDMSRQIRELQDNLLRERQARLAESDTFVNSLREQIATAVSRSGTANMGPKLATDLVALQNTVQSVAETQHALTKQLGDMQQQIDATHSYFRFSEEIAKARKQDAQRLQSAEERFGAVVNRLADLERAFARSAVAESTPTLADHKALGNSVHTLSQKVHHLVDHFKAFHEAFSSQAAKHTKFEQETLAGEQLRREERELEMMQVKDMLKSFQEEVLGRLGNVENEVTAMKDAVATHTSLVESLQSSHSTMKQKSQQLVDVVHQLRTRFLDDLKTKQTVKRHADVLVMLQDEVRDMKRRHTAALQMMHQRSAAADMGPRSAIVTPERRGSVRGGASVLDHTLPLAASGTDVSRREPFRGGGARLGTMANMAAMEHESNGASYTVQSSRHRISKSMLQASEHDALSPDRFRRR